MRKGMVTSRLILRALTRLQRQGRGRAFEHLEKHEPDLAEFVMEELTSLHRDLGSAGLTDREARRLFRQVEQLTLVAIMSLRESHSRTHS